jgi:hypothetical protein
MAFFSSAANYTTQLRSAKCNKDLRLFSVPFGKTIELMWMNPISSRAIPNDACYEGVIV